MFRNEYKMFCVNCQTNLGQVQVKPEIVCDCGCGFYYTLKSNLENKINDNFLLEIHLSDRPENITWTSKSDDEMVLSCPFCAKIMKLLKRINPDNDRIFRCENCHRDFSVEYYA